MTRDPSSSFPSCSSSCYSAAPSIQAPLHHKNIEKNHKEDDSTFVTPIVTKRNKNKTFCCFTHLIILSAVAATSLGSLSCCPAAESNSLNQRYHANAAFCATRPSYVNSDIRASINVPGRSQSSPHHATPRRRSFKLCMVSSSQNSILSSPFVDPDDDDDKNQQREKTERSKPLMPSSEVQEVENDDKHNEKSTLSFSKNTKKNENDARQQFRIVPNWLPYLPTRDQVECLNVLELKEACAERGLFKSGKKAELQSRIIEWTQQQHQKRIDERRRTHKTPLEDILNYHRNVKQDRNRESEDDYNNVILSNKGITGVVSNGNANIASLDGKDAIIPPQDPFNYFENEKNNLTTEDSYDNDQSSSKSTISLSDIKKAYAAKSPEYSNLQIQQMYTKAKYADQNNQKHQAKQILTELHSATPHDGRIIRRLARLETEKGNSNSARKHLQRGIRSNPNSGHLWHGLAMLELNLGIRNIDAARECFKKAILVDKTLPNPYHAWGRLEQSEGNIRAAAGLFRRGLSVAPTNHRLWHALGGLYREAGMKNEAQAAFTKGMALGPNWSHGFFCTSLAYVAYDMGDLNLARARLKEGISGNGGRHAQGWLALAQLEEAEGSVLEARKIYREALQVYENTIRKAPKSLMSSPSYDDEGPFAKPKKLSMIPKQSGDKWISVYQGWARMEESRKNYGLANMVYSRANQMFPNDWRICLNWAKLQAKRGKRNRSRILFEQACKTVGTSNANPYRAYAESEMMQTNYQTARNIFFCGAEAVTRSSDGQERGLAQLMHSWALCEWHLGKMKRAANLFDHALRLTECNNSKGCEGEREWILYSLARFENSRGRYAIAQHCICLAMKEDNTIVEFWKLWADIASNMDNDTLAGRCMEEGNKLEELEKANAKNKRKVDIMMEKLAGRSSMKQMLCKAPWHHKVYSQTVYGNDKLGRGGNHGRSRSKEHLIIKTDLVEP
mmetsp:Transcript_25728/g.37999  ORF Transcript_25728/g.37999 Transcript_25728/m.37999 type:complete len:960 (+) Transcript_25728:204-3083(+)|eukprot:CAMPEP_0195507430 /NCGR_PEP_ID=MMETSP0794_2-20130614/882_1 /TAXON_ID=515487 /ORGANISM="Stephanopyxis turris, Strain CCMP 815" /LENGTH=959 /DNA_ID=CAMNT_0040634111 /DNA_START=128 /DNA_END=3007 /DNA_ORIENTATION=-